MSRRSQRVNVINVLYKYELMEDDLDSNKIFVEENLNEIEFKTIEWICKKYHFLKKIILANFNQDWEWVRLNPLIRAILLYGSFELIILDKKIVINEMLEITKDLSPDDKYKFINGVLENVSDFYEKNKSNQKKDQDSEKDI